MASKRPRRNVTTRISHLEGPKEGVEGFSFSQLKEMKHGVLLQKFSRLENSTKKLSCCFPTSCKCPFETTHSEWNSLLSHLLQHRQECLRRGKKNPRFFETMTFHSVPKKEQPPFSYFDEDGTAKSRTQNAESEEDHLALFLAALNLRRSDPTKPAKILNNTSHNFK
ncbi:Oidioi.mRNA.OKI2018_I69.XSR.g15137.t1.cds [Oikopleura dioica]|uniref:Oidioi.mRNA.OKI2018_I69.XSR.g15137.t1.cds n=1 Tax=Oikopleura dioica TaxID=34765 RepID=A0ABN7SI97_OIKDI|nr:Oidioi.mRNA.OKI2018_I69.XSR.g15137.t1.cds [Oikopleura dioica]